MKTMPGVEKNTLRPMNIQQMTRDWKRTENKFAYFYSSKVVSRMRGGDRIVYYIYLTHLPQSRLPGHIQLHSAYDILLSSKVINYFMFAAGCQWIWPIKIAKTIHTFVLLLSYAARAKTFGIFPFFVVILGMLNLITLSYFPMLPSKYFERGPSIKTSIKHMLYIFFSMQQATISYLCIGANCSQFQNRLQSVLHANVENNKICDRKWRRKKCVMGIRCCVLCFRGVIEIWKLQNCTTPVISEIDIEWLFVWWSSGVRVSSSSCFSRTRIRNNFLIQL